MVRDSNVILLLISGSVLVEVASASYHAFVLTPREPSITGGISCTAMCGQYEESTCDQSEFAQMGENASVAVAEILSSIRCKQVTPLISPSQPEIGREDCKGFYRSDPSVEPTCDSTLTEWYGQKLCHCEEKRFQRCPTDSIELDSGICIKVLNAAVDRNMFHSQLDCYWNLKNLFTFRDTDDFKKITSLIRAVIGPNVEYFIHMDPDPWGRKRWKMMEGNYAEDPSIFEEGSFEPPSSDYMFTPRVYVNKNDKIQAVNYAQTTVPGLRTMVCAAPSRISYNSDVLPKKAFQQFGDSGEVLNVGERYIIQKLQVAYVLSCAVECHKKNSCLGYNFDPADSAGSCTLLRTSFAVDSLWKFGGGSLLKPGISEKSRHFGVSVESQIALTNIGGLY